MPSLSGQGGGEGCGERKGSWHSPRAQAASVRRERPLSQCGAGDASSRQACVKARERPGRGGGVRERCLALWGPSSNGLKAGLVLLRRETEQLSCSRMGAACKR
jgi:hypothetical protein